MRDLPTLEHDEQAIRARFEQLTPSIQASKISIGISAATWAIAGAKVGPVGAAAGAVVGALLGYWNRKAYRMQAYAQMEAEGLIQKRMIKRRDLLSLYMSKFTFVRLPYAELTALVIVPILRKNYPDMSDEELTDVGHAVQRSLLAFRKQFPDIPIELAAEGVLAYYGVIRNPGQDYELALKPTPGEPYQRPPISPPGTPALSPAYSPPPEEKPRKSRLIYFVIGFIVLVMLSKE